MMNIDSKELESLLEDAIWIAHVLFDRNKVSGSSANLSFKYGNKIYITGSGTCFGNLKKINFSVVTLEGKHVQGPNPSKEFPMHKILYDRWDDVKAVIHTHSKYSVLWSCMKHENTVDLVPMYTPYLKMKLGKVVMVPYGKPGSETLFNHFKDLVFHGKGFILQNHGPVVGGNSLMDAFYSLEELEDSLEVAWNLRNESSTVKIHEK